MAPTAITLSDLEAITRNYYVYARIGKRTGLQFQLSCRKALLKAPGSHVHCKSGNILETVQGRDIAIQWKTNRKSRRLSNGTNIDDLERPWRSLYLFETFRTSIPREILNTMRLITKRKIYAACNFNSRTKLKDFLKSQLRVLQK